MIPVIILSVLCLLLAATTLYLGMKISAVSATRNEADQRLEEASRSIADLSRRLEDQSKESQRIASIEFQNMANATMKSSTDTLRNENSREMETLIRPLREQISEFRKVVSDSYIKENASRKSLSDQIDLLMQLNKGISEDARNLTSALKGNSKVQGDWGEMVLETLLERAGMKRGINFKTQAGKDDTGDTFRDAETGALMRPDVVVFLPDSHCMVIDSKVSLTAFAEYYSCDDEHSRQEAGYRHLESVKRHIDELAAKKYQNIVSGAAEHVLMFIPNEGAYFLAFSLDNNLWKYAYDRKVVIVAPTHVFSVMQTVSQLWRLESQDRNAAEIARLGGLIYDKIADFVNDYSKIERHLKSASDAYDNCMRHITNGRTGIAARAERLRALGAKTGKRISQKVLDEIQTPPTEDE